MGDDRPLLSVIIPAYNEEARIEATVASVVTYLAGLEDRYDWEVIVVDDGSTDQTLEAATRASEKEPRVRVARHPANFNLGQALRYGFSLARGGDYLVTMDADLSYDCEHIGRLVEVLRTTTAKVVIASPYMAGGTVTGVPMLRLFASRMANRLLARAAKGDLTTVTGMVRAYDAVFLRKLDLKAMDVEINAEIIYKAQLMRARIVEVPAHLVWTRDDGKRPFRPGRSVSGFAFVSFLFRPYAFFLVPSALLFVLATLLWLAAWFTADADRSLLLAAVAATSTISSVVFAGVGVLSAQAKRYFEELFHLGTSTISERRRVDRA